MENRPSHKELSGKIKAAAEAIGKGRVYLVTGRAERIVLDAFELGYDIEKELNSVLSELITKTKPEDYNGGKPPKKSYKGEIHGKELFSFTVKSDRFSCDIYYKYSIWKDDLWLTSLHKDRPY